MSLPLRNDRWLPYAAQQPSFSDRKTPSISMPRRARAPPPLNLALERKRYELPRVQDTSDESDVSVKPGLLSNGHVLRSWTPTLQENESYSVDEETILPNRPMLRRSSRTLRNTAHKRSALRQSIEESPAPERLTPKNTVQLEPSPRTKIPHVGLPVPRRMCRAASTDILPTISPDFWDIGTSFCNSSVETRHRVHLVPFSPNAKDRPGTPSRSPRRSILRRRSTVVEQAQPPKRVRWADAPPCTTLSPLSPLSRLPPPQPLPMPTNFEEEEFALLQDTGLDPRFLRPVPDLSQVLTSVTSVFGEPGSGLLATGFVPDFTGTTSNGGGKAVPTCQKPSKLEYKTRKYSLNPSLKSRHLDIRLFRLRIPHYRLLGLDLTEDARRDAITIGHKNGSKSLPSGNSGTDGLTRKPGQLSMRRRTEHQEAARANSRSAKTAVAGTGMFTNRTGNRRRNSDKNTWMYGADGQRKRRRESYPEERQSRHEKELRRKVNNRRAADEGRFDRIIGAAIAKDASGQRVGNMDNVVWRLIRVSAVVEVDEPAPVGKIGITKREEVQSAWWVVPERAVGVVF